MTEESRRSEENTTKTLICDIRTMFVSTTKYFLENVEFFIVKMTILLCLRFTFDGATRMHSHRNSDAFLVADNHWQHYLLLFRRLPDQFMCGQIEIDFCSQQITLNSRNIRYTRQNMTENDRFDVLSNRFYFICFPSISYFRFLSAWEKPLNKQLFLDSMQSVTVFKWTIKKKLDKREATRETAEMNEIVIELKNICWNCYWHRFARDDFRLFFFSLEIGSADNSNPSRTHAERRKMLLTHKSIQFSIRVQHLFETFFIIFSVHPFALLGNNVECRDHTVSLAFFSIFFHSVHRGALVHLLLQVCQ